MDLGIEETSSIFTYDEGKIFLIWKANFQNENNLGVLSVGNSEVLYTL